jgi:hypothetical protein
VSFLSKFFTSPKTNFDIDNTYIFDFGPGCWPPPIPNIEGGKRAYIFKQVDEYIIVDAIQKEGEKLPVFPSPILAHSFLKRRIITKIAELESQGWIITAFR